jgi:hypothetical protein
MGRFSSRTVGRQGAASGHGEAEPSAEPGLDLAEHQHVAESAQGPEQEERDYPEQEVEQAHPALELRHQAAHEVGARLVGGGDA